MGSRHSTIALYSDASSIHSHRVRLVLADKGIQSEICTVVPGEASAELLELNSQGTLPTLQDRELALYDARVIIEYLDERYPHPPLMPIDPVSRARTRLALYRIEADWYTLRPDSGFQSDPAQAARQLSESLTAASDVFAAMPYFFSEDYSILDVTLAPLLWRLPSYGIVLPSAAAPVLQYARRMFARPAFQASLSDVEREMEHS
ncbi:glutathione S-transferase N-terminal domain-containing protein [Granulosicoccus antarcticus]|uniref:glutathione S-transferase N-terminal domain-containing protein n=1 Tax=Granulosicoccus antarcticus TaxID=437505 RepID=UPI00197AC624